MLTVCRTCASLLLLLWLLLLRLWLFCSSLTTSDFVVEANVAGGELHFAFSLRVCGYVSPQAGCGSPSLICQQTDSLGGPSYPAGVLNDDYLPMWAYLDRNNISAGVQYTLYSKDWSETLRHTTHGTAAAPHSYRRKIRLLASASHAHGYSLGLLRVLLLAGTTETWGARRSCSWSAPTRWARCACGLHTAAFPGTSTCRPSTSHLHCPRLSRR